MTILAKMAILPNFGPVGPKLILVGHPGSRGAGSRSRASHEKSEIFKENFTFGKPVATRRVYQPRRRRITLTGPNRAL